MCRGAKLGPCCAGGCDEPIRCRDTGGYCNKHDPFSWMGEDTALDEVVDDPEKRRAYTLARLTEGIASTERTIQADQVRLAKMHERVRELS